MDAATPHLLFGEPAATDARLVFGAGSDAPLAQVQVHASMPALSAAFTFIQPSRVAVAASLPALSVAAVEVRASVPMDVVAGALPALSVVCEARYFSRTERPTVGVARAWWHLGQALEGAAGAGHEVARSVASGCSAAFERGAPRSAASGGHFGALRSTPARGVHPFSSASSMGAAAPFSFDVALRIMCERLGVFESGAGDRHGAVFIEQDACRDSRLITGPRWQVGLRRGAAFGASHRPACPHRPGWSARHQDAMRARPGVWAVAPPAPVQRCYAPCGSLVFSVAAPGDGRLVFICERTVATGREPIAVPVRRVYVVLNQVVLQRVSDGAQIPVESLSLSLDASSWAWGFEASIPGWAQALVSPTGGAPVELMARINGAEVRLLAEGIERERAFASSTLRVYGRGHQAVLAPPYAPVMSFANAQARTARQLMDDVLTINGVPLGWTIDWGIADWNVPAGAFSHQGTWIEALAAIAGAAGGYLLPHPTAKTIRVRHRYPVAPWEWGAVVPDVSLPVDAVSRESMRWVSKPGYNRVYVSGEIGGIRGKVTRAGSAGNVLAPMVVDRLVTDAPAARQRGIAVLADTGRQIEATLRLPVFEQTGIIEPGAFVEYQDGSVSRLAMVRGTQVQAGFPEVWQTLEVQAYE